MNNTDRHAKNCVFDPFGKRVYAIDNGLAFGPALSKYYNVFHRFLFRHNLKLTSEERTRLASITPDQLLLALGRYLTRKEVLETFLRIRWVLGHPNLAFELLAEGREGKDEFPSRRKWFKDQLKTGQRNRVLARVEAMGAPLLQA